MFWELCDARLVQIRITSSAVNAENLSLSNYPVPEGKVWVVLGCGYFPDIAETQTVGFYKVTQSGNLIGLLNPASLALGSSAPATFIEQGMEYVLLPGEYVSVHRGGHTVGSAMVIAIQFIELDLPLYAYTEPQEVKRQKHLASSALRVFGGGGGSRARGEREPSLREGRGTKEAK